MVCYPLPPQFSGPCQMAHNRSRAAQSTDRILQVLELPQKAVGTATARGNGC